MIDDLYLKTPTAEDAKWVIEAYGFILPFSVNCSGSRFAGLIRETFDCEHNRRNFVAASWAEYGIANACRVCGDSCGYTLTPECKVRTTKNFYPRKGGVK